jgi:predicted dehydrogenase
MLGWMMGLPVDIQAIMSNTSHDNAEVEDLSVAVMRYASGALAQVTSSVVHHGEEQQLIFQGRKARISAPWKIYASTSKENGFPVRDEETEKALDDFYQALPLNPYQGHTAQIDNVLTALETGSEVLIGGVDGRQSLELITGIYKAAITREVVKLPLKKDDIFYTASGIQEKAPHFYEKSASVENFGSEDITIGRSL